MAWHQLTVGGFNIEFFDGKIPLELLAVFDDEMYSRRRFDFDVDHGALTPRMRGKKCGCGQKHPSWIHQLRGEGLTISNRLDVLGITAAQTLEKVESWLKAAKRNEQTIRDFPKLKRLTAHKWIDELRLALAGDDLYSLLAIGDDGPPADVLFVVRAMLMANVNQFVELDLTQMMNDFKSDKPEPICATALLKIRELTPRYSPLIVLTEGRSDVEVLEPGLRLLYPHLRGLINFMDFDARPPGGAGWLAGLAKGFISAGIANRVVVLFDNDSAARAAVSKIGKVPLNIRIRHLPALEMLSRYPTLGPPNIEHPSGNISVANVNGMAASIELYFGKDVLRDEDGFLQPVQWTSLEKSLGQYQGEVTDKETLHQRYKQKIRVAEENPDMLATQDWSGIRAILEELIHAFD